MASEHVGIEHFAVKTVPVLQTDAVIEAHSVFQTHTNLNQGDFTLRRNKSKDALHPAEGSESD